MGTGLQRGAGSFAEWRGGGQREGMGVTRRGRCGVTADGERERHWRG